MTDHPFQDEFHPTAERAEAISRGEDGFASERSVTVVAAPVVNRLLLGAVIALSLITITAIVCLTVFSVARGQERRSFNGVLTALQHDLDDARQARDAIADTLDATNVAITCRAQAQLD